MREQPGKTRLRIPHARVLALGTRRVAVSYSTDSRETSPKTAD